MKIPAILALVAAAGFVQAQEVRGVTQPHVIHRTEPQYTDEARAEKIEGNVILSFIVGTDGVAKDIHIVRGLGKGLDEKAVECLQNWRFQPGTRNGEPIGIRAQAEIKFQLPAH